MQIGDFVIAEKGYPEMGNASGHGYSFGKITKVTPTGKYRIKELPTEHKNEEYDMNSQTTSWDTYITNFEPDPKDSGLLINSKGEWQSGRYYRNYQVTKKEDLQGPFRETYDGYS